MRSLNGAGAMAAVPGAIRDGKANGDIGSRVYGHMGNACMPTRTQKTRRKQTTPLILIAILVRMRIPQILQKRLHDRIVAAALLRDHMKGHLVSERLRIKCN